MYLLIACAAPLAMFVYIEKSRVAIDGIEGSVAMTRERALPLLPYMGCILIGIGDSFVRE
jgi:hypothetical protein